jgi:tetratricopeptide (TPR) repeat protein
MKNLSYHSASPILLTLMCFVTSSMTVLRTAANAEDEQIEANQEIEEQVQAAFDLELAKLKLRIEKAEIDLRLVRNEFDLRSKNRDKIVAIRVKQLLSGDVKEETTPDTPSVAKLNAKGWQAWNAQRFSDAIDAFEVAVGSDPTNIAVLNGLGWSYLSIGEYEDSLKYLKMARKIEPNHGGVLNGIGQAATALKRFDEAEQALLAAVNGSIKDQSESTYAKSEANAPWFSLINLYVSSGKPEKAKEWTERFLKHNPKNPMMLQIQQRIEAIVGK